MPIKATLITGRRSFLVIPQSSNNAGAINPTTPVSIPSAKITKKQSIKIIHCCRDNFLVSTACCISSIIFIIKSFYCIKNANNNRCYWLELL
ncbi:hypothetical protein [Acinetobacter bereziniae]|nr:hypothetical protein [Acinetobacter bereziniae]